MALAPDAFITAAPDRRKCGRYANRLSDSTLPCDRFDRYLRVSGDREPAADPVSKHILQRTAVQRSHEITVCVDKNRPERTGREQGTGLVFPIETFDDVEAVFRIAHHSADVDHIGRALQSHPAALAANGLNVANGRKVIDDLPQVVPGDSIRVGSFRDCAQPARMRAEKDQHTQRVIRKEG